MIGTSVMKGLESPGIRQVSIKWFILLVNVDISVYGYNHETFCNTTLTKTAQKMKFSIKEFFTKSPNLAVSCEFGHIYWKNP